MPKSSLCYKPNSTKSFAWRVLIKNNRINKISGRLFRKNSLEPWWSLKTSKTIEKSRRLKNFATNNRAQSAKEKAFWTLTRTNNVAKIQQPFSHSPIKRPKNTVLSWDRNLSTQVFKKVTANKTMIFGLHSVGKEIKK